MPRLRLPLALIVLLTLCWTLPVAAGDEAHAKDARPADIEAYYLVYMAGSKMGWAKTTLSHAKIDGREMVVEGMHLYMLIKREHDGATFETIVESKDYSLTTGQSVRSWQTQKSGGQDVRIEVEHSEKIITVTHRVDGKSMSKELKREHDDFYSAQHVFNLLKAQDFKPGTSVTYHSVSASAMKVEPSTWKVNGPAEFKTREGHTFSGTSITQTAGETSNTMLFDEHGVPLKVEISIITAERTPEMPKDFKPDVFKGLANISHSDVAVPAQAQFFLKSMEVHFAFKHDDNNAVPYLLDTNSYHDVIKYERDGRTGYAALLKSQALPKDFKAPTLPMKNLPEAVSPFLKPTPMCPSDDKDLLAEARKQVGNETDSLAVARKLCSFVFKFLEKEPGATGNASALQTYKEKRGDCTEHSALFVALARAAGLPARNCSGVVYLTMGDGKGVFGMHAWSEVWIGQWVPVDATVDEVGTSARYLFLSHDEPELDYGRNRSMRWLEQEVQPSIGAYEFVNGKTWTRKDFTRFDFSKPLGPHGK